MARKFIVISALEFDGIERVFSITGKAPSKHVAPRLGSYRAAAEEAQEWTKSGYYAAVLRPLKGGGWGVVAFFQREEA